MNRIVVCLAILLLFGAIFGLTVQNIGTNLREEAPVISASLQLFAPAAAYADTTDGEDPKPPPPPPND